MPGLVALPNAARHLSLPARPGGPPSRQGGRAFVALAIRLARAKRPEMAPQTTEKIESAPGNGRLAGRVDRGPANFDSWWTGPCESPGNDAAKA